MRHECNRGEDGVNYAAGCLPATASGTEVLLAEDNADDAHPARSDATGAS